jgi:hypothetical protein
VIRKYLKKNEKLFQLSSSKKSMKIGTRMKEANAKKITRFKNTADEKKQKSYI